jgi:hypothetical protein
MTIEDDAAAVLAGVVPLGNTPTTQAQDLADAVARHVSNRPVAKASTGLGEQLCRAWGLNPNRVAHIVIDVPANDMPTVHVTMYADDLVGLVVSSYRLEGK